MTYGHILDPSQEFYLELERQLADQNQRAFERFATSANADSLASYSLSYPQGSSVLGLAMAQGGIPSGTPVANQLVNYDISSRDTLGPIETAGEGWWDGITGVLDEWVVNPLQGVPRWTFAAWDGLYNLVAGGAPIRALQLSKEQGISFAEAWSQQDPYFFEAVGGLLQGERVNIGSGWLPNSDVAPDVSAAVNEGMMGVEQQTASLPTPQRYAARLEAAPGVWRNAVSQSMEQAALGKPIVQMNYAETERPLFTNPSGNKYPWSPGRIVAAHLTEPGTKPFHVISASGDFTSQLFLDPMEWVGVGWARHSRHARTIWGSVNKVADDAVSLSKKPPAPTTALAIRESPVGGRAAASADDVINVPEAALEIQSARPRIGLPGNSRYADEPSTAWWVSGTEVRTPSQADPPDWFLEMHRAAREAAQQRTPPGNWTRRMAGVYDMDLPRVPGAPQKKLRIQRVGQGRKSYWEVLRPDGERVGVLPDDPRFSTPQKQFKTLEEAKAAANAHVGSYVDDTTRVSGMTADEFARSGEDFYLRLDGHDDIHQTRSFNRSTTQDNGTWRGATKRTQREEVAPGVLGPERPVSADTPRTQHGAVSRIKMRVFGRTLDLREARMNPDAINALPTKLQDALRADSKLATEEGVKRLRGFGTNRNLDKWENTTRWAENNGYGKIIWDEDDVLLVDKFVGGNSKDPLGRVWFEAADEPIGLSRIDDVMGVTAGEVDDVMREVADLMDTLGRQVDEVATKVDEVGAQLGMDAADVDAAFREGGSAFAVEPIQDRMGMLTPAQRVTLNRVQEAHASTAPSPTFSRIRSDYDPRFKLQGKRANLFLDRLLATSRRAQGKDGSIAQMDGLLRHLEKRNISVPNEVRNSLYNARNRGELESTLVRWMTSDGPTQVVLPGGAHFGALAVAGVRYPNTKIIDQPWFQRRIAMNIPTVDFNIVEDPSTAYRRFVDALPHYNIRRGEVIELLDDSGNGTGVFRNVEEVLERLRTMREYDKPEAYRIMGDFSELLFSSLAKNENVDPRLARHVSRWWRESLDEAIYEAERFGRTNLSDGVKDMTIINGELVGGIGPQISADLWTGAVSNIPDPRTLKRVANNSDVVGRIANSIALKKVEDPLTRFGVKYQERALVRYYDHLVTKVWKPFVLLRGAWTLRILMDDQMRLAAEGYSAFNHPLRILNYALTQPQDWRNAFRKGFVDVHGVRISSNNLDELSHAHFLRDALMSRPDDPRLGTGAYGRRQIAVTGRGSKEYIDGLAFEVEHFSGSPLNRVLAGSKSDNPVDEAVKWLQGRKGARYENGRLAELSNQAELHREAGKEIPGLVQRILDADYDTLYRIVNRQYAAMHHKLGGEVVLIDDAGRRFNWQLSLLEGSEDKASMAKGARWEVVRTGDTGLLDFVATHKLHRNVSAATRNLERADLATKLRARVRANPEAFPQFVRVPRTVADSGMQMSDYDKAIRGFYNFFMTKPSDALSRVPEFRRAYWDKVSDLYPYMDEATKADILAKAPTVAERKALANAKRIKGVEGQITSLDHIDEIAKAYGLTMVEATLFDLSNKRNISDSLRLIFPFVEAWGEFITRWGRLMVWGERNIATARRFQQVIEGARESGFFHENEFGQEVFDYPAFMTGAQIQLHNILNNIPGAEGILGGDVDPAMAEAVRASGSVESLNFASGVIPGFGPVFQFAAKALPEDPKFDWVRDVLAPFGTEGGFFGTVSPAWVKRIMAAHGGNDDPQLEYTWNSTVIDTIRTMIDTGEFAGVTSQDDINALIAEAEARARGLLMVRAAATFWNPTSPSYTFEKEDRYGMVWSYSNLGREFYDLTQELGSEQAAFDEFYRRFGFLPHAFSGGKTYSIVDRSLTDAGYRFERSRPDLFSAYPSTAMYLDPTIDTESEYNHTAMLTQLRQGEREGWNAQQFLYLQQDQLGDLWWDNASKQAANIPDTATRNSFLATVRSEIEVKYPYWRKPIPGKVLSVTNEEQMAEVQRMLRDPQLEGAPVLEAATLYEAARSEVLAQLATFGASSIDGPKALHTDAGRWATFGRSWLRQTAEELIAQYPEFGPMFRSVYSFEVDESHDAPTPTELTIYDSYDVLDEVFGVTSG